MARRAQTHTVRVARAAGAVALVAGGVLTFNLLAPEAIRIGPVLWRGAARVLGPLVLALGVPGLVAGRGGRALVWSGLVCMAGGMLGGAAAYVTLEAEPFLRSIFIGASGLLALVGISVMVAGREEASG